MAVSTQAKSHLTKQVGLIAEPNPHQIGPQVSVVLPCLNEEATIGICVQKVIDCLSGLGRSHEVIVVDNGCTDSSVACAQSAGARIVRCDLRGYGAAIDAGVRASHGELLVIADADDSYALEDLDPFLKPLCDGSVVIGNRFTGGISGNAMPWLHRYVGNPLLTLLVNLVFQTKSRDVHCGIRSFSKNAYQEMCPTSIGMEFASETVILATRLGLRVVEIPTHLSLDGRNGKSHLRPLRDATRHIALILMAGADRIFFCIGLALIGVLLALSIRGYYIPRLEIADSSLVTAISLSLGILGGTLIAASSLLNRMLSKSARQNLLDKSVGILFSRSFTPYVVSASIAGGIYLLYSCIKTNSIVTSFLPLAVSLICLGISLAVSNYSAWVLTQFPALWGIAKTQRDVQLSTKPAHQFATNLPAIGTS